MDTSVHTEPGYFAACYGICMVLCFAGAALWLSTFSCRGPDMRPYYAERTPPEVKQLLESERDYIYLDVRTEAEFAAGHVPGAWNVPVMVRDESSEAWKANDHFLDVVEANISKEAKVIVGCRSGRRSAKAFQIMQDAGFIHLVNMAGGFGGATDEAGRVTVPGWSMLEYPAERGDGGNHGYASLRAHAHHVAPPRKP